MLFWPNFGNFLPLLSITFPKGFRISKNIGHPTSGSGDKKTVKRYFKSEQTHKHTHTHMGQFCLTQKWPNPGLFNLNFVRSLQLSGLINRIQINPYLTVLTALVALVNL